jgi:hypothetical protein
VVSFFPICDRCKCGQKGARHFFPPRSTELVSMRAPRAVREVASVIQPQNQAPPWPVPRFSRARTRGAVAVGIPTPAPGQLYRTRMDTSTDVRLGPFALSFRFGRRRNVETSVQTTK